jgi:hypothetical protein
MRTTDSGHSGNSVVVPGHRDKYALVERERRFLMAGLPSGGAAGVRRVDIVDRYLTGTRLRLRRVGSPGSAGPELKLTQKVPAAQPGPVRGLITNLYLSSAEYDVRIPELRRADGPVGAHVQCMTFPQIALLLLTTLP